MSGFYGGKQGRTFDIVNSFTSVNAMANAFSRGNSYTDVLFGEYVIIDNAGSVQNGMLFRRGLNFNEEIIERGSLTPSEWIERIKAGVGAGAIYIGRFAGRSGDSLSSFSIQDSTISYDITQYDQYGEAEQPVHNTYALKEVTSITKNGDYLIANYTIGDSTQLGPVGSQFHVAGRYTIADIIQGGSLENGFPEDTDPNKMGWLITIITTRVGEGQRQDFYIFDYHQYNTENYPYDHTVVQQGISHTYYSKWYRIPGFAEAQLANIYKIVKDSGDETHYDVEEETGKTIPSYPTIERGLSFIVTGGNDEESQQEVSN